MYNIFPPLDRWKHCWQEKNAGQCCHHWTHFNNVFLLLAGEILIRKTTTCRLVLYDFTLYCEQSIIWLTENWTILLQTWCISVICHISLLGFFPLHLSYWTDCVTWISHHNGRYREDVVRYYNGRCREDVLYSKIWSALLIRILPNEMLDKIRSLVSTKPEILE